MPRLPAPLSGAVERVRSDLDEDPYLVYVLALAVVTAGFGIWFRVPNFAAPDEFSRLVDPMEAAGKFVADPGWESLRRGVTDGRSLGATFYLYGLIMVPVLLAVLVSGHLGEFARLGTLTSRWDLWHAAPAWFWTSAILLGRLSSVAFGVGCVYLTYRIGTDHRNRWTGRVAATLLALSVGFVGEAHLVGEDVPMLFFLLLTIHLAARYAETGDRRRFWLGCLTGGLAIAFKLSGGVAALLLGVAHLQRARDADDPLATLVDPTLLIGGLLLGVATVYVGLPSVLVGGPGELFTRTTTAISSKTGKSGGLAAPIWYWFVRQYLRGLGWPLFLAAAAGLLATVAQVVRRRRLRLRAELLLAGVVLYLLVYSRWEFVRLRHLLPTIPMVLVLFAGQFDRFRTRPDAARIARPVLAVLLVTTALFVGVADFQYANDPRDRATAWMRDNVEDGATVEVYENSVADVAVVHGRPVQHYAFSEHNATHSDSLVLDERAFTDWMVSTPDREPAYVQLTANELALLNPHDPEGDRFPRRRAFVRRLLNGEYDYAVVASFGERPRNRSLWSELWRSGVFPELDGSEKYVVILKRTG